jgi:hypothetical protein
MTTLEPMDTAAGSKAVTTLLSNMFEFDPTLTLPEKPPHEIEKTECARDDDCVAPETTALYHTELFSPMVTSPITDALKKL